MVAEKDILGVINYIKETVDNEFKKQNCNVSAEKVFYNGDCGNMYDLLHTAFPNDTIPCAIYINNYPYHIITKIDNKTYDISGEIDLDGYKKYIDKNNDVDIDNMNFEIKELKPGDYLVKKMCDKFGKDDSGACYREGDIASDIIEKIKQTIYSRKHEIDMSHNNEERY